MFCTQCGKRIKDDSAFCAHCGSPVRPDAPSPAVASPTSENVPSSPNRKNAKIQQLAADGSLSHDGIKKKLVIGITVAAIVLVVALSAVFILLSHPPGSDMGASSQDWKSVRSEYSASSSSSSSASSSGGAHSSSTASTAGSTEHAEPSSSMASDAASNPYILADSDSRYYSAAELNGMSDHDLFLVRNEIFARHGRGFKNAELVEYFTSQPWYSQRYTPEQFDSMPSPLNDFERKNMETMLSIEEGRNSPYLA